MRRVIFSALVFSLCCAATSTGIKALAAPTSTSGATTTNWSQVAETTEHAFTVDIPAGYTLESGVGRHPGAAMAHPWFTTSSADGATTISLGLPPISNFTLPGRFMQEGQSKQLPAGLLTCAHFMTGQEYLSTYGTSLLPVGATDIVMQGSQDEPEWAAKAQSFLGPNCRSTVSVGSARYSFALNGEPKSKTIAIQTMLNPGQFPGMPSNWSVVSMWGCYTRKGNESQAQAMADHVRHSFRIDKQWVEKQCAAIQQAGAQMMALGQQMNEAQSAALRQQAASNQALLNARHQAGMETLQTQGNIARMRAQAQSDWHSHEMVNHYAQMAAKDNNNYHEVLMIQNKHLEWDPTLHGNVAVPNY